MENSAPETTHFDGMEIDEAISNIDPLTKQLITHPVRNRRCNHVYDKKTVEASLKINAALRCPIVGCANKVKILMVDLIEDKELKRKMIHMRRMADRANEDSD